MIDFRALPEDGRRTKRGTGGGREGGVGRSKRRKTGKKARKEKNKKKHSPPQESFFVKRMKEKRFIHQPWEVAVLKTAFLCGV